MTKSKFKITKRPKKKINFLSEENLLGPSSTKNSNKSKS